MSGMTKTTVINPRPVKPQKSVSTKKPAANRPLGFCPFTGKPVQFKHVPQMGRWIATNGRFVFGPFKTQAELLIAYSTRDGVPPTFDAKQALQMDCIRVVNPNHVRPPATAPRIQCPFTGEKIEIVQSDPADPTSRWVIRGENYVIDGFKLKRQAEHYFSTRLGVTPAFSATDVDAAVKGPGESPSEALEGFNVEALEEAAAGVSKPVGTPDEE